MTCVESAWNDFEMFQKSVTIEPTVTSNEYFCVCGGYKTWGYCGVPVCGSCGREEREYIDPSAEWTSGVSEDGVVSDPARCGMATDTELFSEQWGSGMIINTRGASYAVKRLAKISFHSSMNHKDRSLFHAYKDIEAAALTILNLSANVIRDSKVMYKKFNGEKLTRGAVRTGIKANCVLAACQMAKVQRSTKEVADAFGIPPKDISRTFEMFRETIFATPALATESETDSSIINASGVLPRILNSFSHVKDINGIRIKCTKMSRKLEDCVPLMGKTPHSVASVIIYIVMNGEITKQDICNTCKISMPTLNKIETIVKEHLKN